MDLKVKAVGLEDGKVVHEKALVDDRQFERLGLNQPLALDDCVALEALKIVLLICGVLVHDEEIVALPADDETEVELPNHLKGERLQLARTGRWA
jgi:hypothetical protein